MAGSDVEAPAPASLEVVKKANSMDVVASLRNVNDMKAMDDPKMIGSIASIEGSLKSLASKVSGTSASVRGPARSLVSSIRTSDGTVREDAKEMQPEDGEPDHQHGPARVSDWYHTSFNLLAEIMGTGILSLPSTMAGLGYILGSFSIVVYYAGFILSKVKNRYYKQVLSYGDMSYIIHGEVFEKFTRGLLYANWYSLMCYYILALASCLMSAFYWRTDICFWMWGLMAVAILVPFAQPRTFHAISFFSLLSTVSIIVAVAIIAAAFITGTTTEEEFVPPTWKVPQQPFLSGYSNIANILFAFQGQSEFYEMASEMKNPKKFPFSLGVSQVIMASMYLFTALLAYTYGGANVNGFILYSLPENALRTVCSLLVGVHIIVAYMITNQPLAYKTHEFLSKATIHASGTKPALIHLAITSVFLAIGYIVSNVIPFFADMQGVISAFAAAPIIFFFPAYFYIQACRKNGDWAGVPIYEKAWLATMIVVLFPFCFGVGLVSSISGIATNWSGSDQKPFQCIVASQL